jgi:hypothetical protein
MKTIKTLFLVLAVALMCTAVLAGDEKPWFDLETCAYCKNFNLGEGNYIVDHMKGNYHTMPNGFLAIMTIEDDYKDEFAKAGEGMKKVGEDMAKTGVVPQMCGHCTTYGELMMAGAASQEFNSDVAMAYMMTSDNPEVVKKLHAFAQKNNEEMTKWKSEKAAAKAKEAGK